MGMPRNLILIRHGESEGNVASNRSKKGDDSGYSPEFRNRHSSTWRLTKRGREQAKVAGVWIKKNLGLTFDRHYTSEYIRAMETAGLLGIADAQWYVDFYLRERDWGDLDVMPVSERDKRYAEAMKRRKIDSFFWNPPNGQSMADLCLRVDRVLQTLHRECDGKNVAIVCHGEVMWAFRVRLERLSQERFRELDLSRNPHDRIHNCQIIHYTRAACPELSFAEGDYFPHFRWMRSICPWDVNLSNDGWNKIARPKYSNKDLLTHVSKIKPLLK